MTSRSENRLLRRLRRHAHLPGLGVRGYRWLAEPVNRRRLARALPRLREFFAGVASEERPAVLVVVPETMRWLRLCLKLVPREVPILLLYNGVADAGIETIGREFPEARGLRLPTLPGTFLRHGAVLEAVVRSIGRDFTMLDHDCYVFDPKLFGPVAWREEDFLAVPDDPGFVREVAVDEQDGSVLRLPRTHFLVVRTAALLRILDRHRIGLDVYRSAPGRLAGPLGRLGLGRGRKAAAQTALYDYDTMQLAMALALADGLTVRYLEVGERAVLHIGHTANRALKPYLAELEKARGE